MNIDTKKRLFILTGSSGAGKSTVLEVLRKRGYPVVEEMARKVIAEESEKEDGIQRSDPKFQLFLSKRQKEEESKLPEQTCFLDRSVVDNIAYAQSTGQTVHATLKRMIKDYEKEVFFLELPPKSKFGKEGVTFTTYEQSAKLQKTLLNTYDVTGFTIIHVEFAPYETQADFIEQKVKELHWKE